MARIFINKSAAFALLLIPGLATAEKNDFQQPIKVDSEFQFVDGKTKTSIFREDVHITQGSLTIDADEVEVRAGEGKGKEIFIARGNPAVYQQTLDDDSTIKAMADEIQYTVNDRTLTLNGSAELHQNNSMVKGTSITFNMELEQLIAQGSESEDGNGRVTTIFQPDDSKQLDNQQDNN